MAGEVCKGVGEEGGGGEEVARWGCCAGGGFWVGALEGV